MRKRNRHDRRAAGSHGGRARPVREAAWSKVCDRAFAFMDWLPGIYLMPSGPPQIADEQEFFHPLGGLATEIIKPQEFGAAMSGEEILAWLEASVNGGMH